MKKSITSYQAQMVVIEGIESHATLNSIVKKLSKFEFNFEEDANEEITLKQWVITEMTKVLFHPEEYNLKLQLRKAA